MVKYNVATDSYPVVADGIEGSYDNVSNEFDTNKPGGALLYADKYVRELPKTAATVEEVVVVPDEVSVGGLTIIDAPGGAVGWAEANTVRLRHMVFINYNFGDANPRAMTFNGVRVHDLEPHETTAIHHGVILLGPDGEGTAIIDVDGTNAWRVTIAKQVDWLDPVVGREVVVTNQAELTAAVASGAMLAGDRITINTNDVLFAGDGFVTGNLAQNITIRAGDGFTPRITGSKLHTWTYSGANGIWHTTITDTALEQVTIFYLGQMRRLMAWDDDAQLALVSSGCALNGTTLSVRLPLDLDPNNIETWVPETYGLFLVNFQAQDFLVENLTFENFGATNDPVFQLEWATRVKIRNCHFRGLARSAFQMANPTKVKVHDNLFEAHQQDGTLLKLKGQSFGTNGTEPSTSTYISDTGTEVEYYNNTFDGVGDCIIAAGTQTNLSIVENTFTKSVEETLTLEGEITQAGVFRNKFIDCRHTLGMATVGGGPLWFGNNLTSGGGYLHEFDINRWNTWGADPDGIYGGVEPSHERRSNLSKVGSADIKPWAKQYHYGNTYVQDSSPLRRIEEIVFFGNSTTDFPNIGFKSRNNVLVGRDRVLADPGGTNNNVDMDYDLMWTTNEFNRTTDLFTNDGTNFGTFEGLQSVQEANGVFLDPLLVNGKQTVGTKGTDIPGFTDSEWLALDGTNHGSSLTRY